MDAIFRLSGAGKRDPTIDEWLSKTDALTAIARTWFERMRHVKLEPGQEPDSLALRNLIHAAYLDVKLRLRAS